MSLLRSAALERILGQAASQETLSSVLFRMLAQDAILSYRYYHRWISEAFSNENHMSTIEFDTPQHWPDGLRCAVCEREWPCADAPLILRGDQPTLTVVQDFDGAFERLVRRWIARKVGSFKHTEIRITSGPYRSSAVSYTSRNGVLTLDFYSALRTGFGALSDDDVKALVELL